MNQDVVIFMAVDYGALNMNSYLFYLNPLFIEMEFIAMGGGGFWGI